MGFGIRVWVCADGSGKEGNGGDNGENGLELHFYGGRLAERELWNEERV